MASGAKASDITFLEMVITDEMVSNVRDSASIGPDFDADATDAEVEEAVYSRRERAKACDMTSSGTTASSDRADLERRYINASSARQSAHSEMCIIRRPVSAEDRDFA